MQRSVTRAGTGRAPSWGVPDEVLGALRRRRMALATTLAAILFAATVAVLPGYLPMPFGSARGWPNLPLVFILFGYVAISLLLGALASLAVFLEGPRSRPPAPRLRLAPSRLLPRPDRSIPAPERPANPSTGTAHPAPDSGPAAGRYVAWRACLISLAGDRAVARGTEPAAAVWPSLVTGSGQALDRSDRRGRHVLAAGLFGVLILTQGLSHLGPRSASWATGRPREELATTSADGYVFWLEGWPLQSDSSSFVDSLAVMSGGRSLGEIDTIGARSGRMAYPFIVSLVARLTAPLGSVYAGFVAVNLLLWWGGAMAVYDLARQARHSWATGMLGGTLAATGIGFTFMAGNAMSTAAAYGAVPIVLWLLHRLRVFASGSRWSDVVLTGCLSGVAGLLNSLAPFYLGFALFAYVGRTPLHRLLLWAATVLAVGVAWGRALDLAGDVPGIGLGGAGQLVAGVVAMAPLVVCLAGAAAFARLPRRWGEWLVGSGAVLGLAGGAALLAQPQLTTRLAMAALSSLHLPDYLLMQGVPLDGQLHTSWGAIAGALRQGAFGDNVLAAFPPVVLLPALVGTFRLPRRWREWALAVAMSAALVTFVMNSVTGTHHPRILFVAYPAVYLLAASGLRNLFDVASRYVNRPLAVAAVAVAVLATAVPANASLWGDWSYANRFHFVVGK